MKIEKDNCITSELLALYGINYCFLNIKYGTFMPKSYQCQQSKNSIYDSEIMLFHC